MANSLYGAKKAWVDTDICWRWFDKIFIPEVVKKTAHPVLLIMDNAPGHFREVKKNNVTVKLLPPNVTSWKQPMDLGVIAALKKRYKHIYLTDVLNFYKLEDPEKTQLVNESKQMRRGTIGVAHGKAAHLLDAANYISRAWEAVSPTTIKNCFCKADLKMNLTNQIDLDEVSLNAFIQLFKDIQINITTQEVDDYLQLDKEGSQSYNECILSDFTDSDDQLQHIEAVINHNDAESFESFQALYNKSVALGSELYTAKAKLLAGDKYESLVTNLQAFQKDLKELCDQ